MVSESENVPEPPPPPPPAFPVQTPLHYEWFFKIYDTENPGKSRCLTTFDFMKRIILSYLFN
jgi:hypothetical protein